MAHGYTFDTYINWDLYPPLAFMLSGIFLPLLLVVVKLCCVSEPFCSGVEYGLSALMLKGTLEEIKDEDEIQNGVKYTVKKRKVSKAVIFPLFIFMASVFVSAGVSFWDVFLIDQSFACDPTLDCFPINNSNYEPLTQDPIVDCYDYEDDDNVTITCYQFVFDYSGAVSAAGGMFVFAGITVRLIIEVIFWTVDYKPSGICSAIGHFIASLLVTIFTLSSQFILWGFVIIVIKVPFLSNLLLKSKHDMLQFAAYFWTAATASAGALGLVRDILKEERKKSLYN